MPDPRLQPVWDAWQAANVPLAQVPRIAIPEDEQMRLAAEAARQPGGLRALALMGLAAKQGVNLGAATLESMTSPVGLATTALSGGAGAAGRAGLLGISRAARGAEAALNAPAVAQGAAQMATADSIPTALGGAAQAALGATGMRGAGTHAFPIPKVADAYRRASGIQAPGIRPISQIDRRISTKVADAYDAMRHAPNDPAVKRAYGKMADEVSDQFEFMVKRAGVKVEPWKGKGEPYKSSAAMQADLKTNNHLYYLPSEKEFGKGAAKEGQGNPLMRKGRFGLPVNDEFRVIHDYFGHAERGYGFGPVGEENAARAHAQMFSREAQPAMLTETRGQNSWVNYGPQMRRRDGSIPVQGDRDFIPLRQREFAPQKTGLLPPEMSVPNPTLASMLAPPSYFENPDWAPVGADPYGTIMGGIPNVATEEALAKIPGWGLRP